MWSGRPPHPWRTALDHPKAWLTSLIRACDEAWYVGRLHWGSAERMFDREEARVGTGAVTGALDVVLNGIDPRIRAVKGVLAFDTECSHRVGLGDRQLALVPLLVPGNQMIVDFDSPKIAYIGYPLPGSRTGRVGVRDSARSGADTRLTDLLGPIRAAALRALERPYSMQELALLLHIAPSTLTYHCGQLVKADLVAREHHGRMVWIFRTNRAHQLLEVMDRS